MAFEWVCESCRSPNEPRTPVCAHCGAPRPQARTGRGFRSTGRGKDAVAVFLGIEAVVVVLYMGGVDAKLTWINLGFVGFVGALLAAVLTYFSGERRANR